MKYNLKNRNREAKSLREGKSKHFLDSQKLTISGAKRNLQFKRHYKERKKSNMMLDAVFWNQTVG